MTTIHVYYGPDHEITEFVDKHLRDGDALLTYRESSTTGARDSRGRRIPDGWVMTYGGGDEQILGVWGLLDADKAVEEAKAWLGRHLAEEQPVAPDRENVIDIREWRQSRE